MPDTEARVRQSLRRWADGVEPTPGDPYAAMTAADMDVRSRGRWPLLAVAAVVLVLVALATVLLRPVGDRVDLTPAVTAPPPSVHVDLGALPYVAFRPAGNGWSIQRLTITPPSLSPSHPSMQMTLVGPGQQGIMVTMDPLGSWGPGSSPLPSEILTMRGLPAVETDEGVTRFRVTWDEAGLSWMADGEPFGSRDEMVAILDDLTIVDEATWQASLPPEARAIVTAHPDAGLDYYAGKGAATVATAAPRVPVATELTPH
jgi:hypothetical protein